MSQARVFLQGWVTQNGLGDLDNWNLSLEQSRARLDLKLTAGQLTVSWRLSDTCEAEAVEASTAAEFRSAAPAEPLLRSLASGLPLLKLRPTSGQHRSRGSESDKASPGNWMTRPWAIVLACTIGLAIIMGIEALLRRREARSAKRATHRHSAGIVVLSPASLVVGLGVLEILVRLTGIDQRLVVRALFFQGADIQVHQNSADPFLHYELKPGAHFILTFQGKPPYAVTIDEFGARFPTHPAVKAPGTFRILAFGGSTLYGAAVNDDETIVAALERRLSAEVSPAGSATVHYEVWNFGTSAYTLGQAAHLARQNCPR